MRQPLAQAQPSQESLSDDVVAAPGSALAGWVLFDWANQPFYTLIGTFLFAPYFSNVVVGDATRGQELWGYVAAFAGILVGLGSPYLGALADGQGRRKPWIGLFGVIMVLSMAGLWWAPPKADAWQLAWIVALFVLATLGAEFSTVFTNAIMPTLVPRAQLGRLSGLGYGVGYAGGLASLILMAGFIVVSPDTRLTLLGLAPVLSLDVASRAGDRLVGPFCALWYLVFMIPFFLFVPDAQVPKSANARLSPLLELNATLRSLPNHPSLMLFLIARAIYVDGLSAIFVFGGIYGAAVFGWGPFELGLFGIILSLTGAVGAVIGGFLDDRLGAKRVIMGALVVLIVGALGILSVSASHVLYVVNVPAKLTGSAAFSSPGEQVYLAFAMMIGIVAAPTQAASRSLLARLAPPDRMTQYFGLFAFSGKVTAFLAPILIALVTRWSGNQRLGVSVIVAFLSVGLAMVVFVREGARSKF